MTADLITPTSQLEAVNWALNAVGFPPIGGLTGTIGRDASSALAWLSQTTRDICLKGLWFSRRTVTLTPNSDGYLILPANCLSMAAPDREDIFAAGLAPSPFFYEDWLRLRPVMRQGKVFSVINQSYVWTKPLTILMREALVFEDMPEEARKYAMVQATSFLNGGTLRSPDVDKRLQPLLTLTWNALETAEFENSDHRFL
jgi:hypothetical protein